MSRALLCLALAGCYATTTAAELSLACDWRQTRHMAASGWASHRENNVLLGPTPTVSAIDTYFVLSAAGVALLAMGLTRLGHENAAVALGGVLTGVEATTINDNVRNGTGLCQ